MLFDTLTKRRVRSPIFRWEIFLSLLQNDALGTDVVLFVGLVRLETLVRILGLKILYKDDGSEVMGDGRVKERLRKRNIESFKNVLEIWLN